MTDDCAWPCQWCHRFAYGRSFRTWRGLSIHLRSCRNNPAHWDLLEWVPFFNQHLRIVGGCMNRGTAWRSFHDAAQVLGFADRESDQTYRLACWVQKFATEGRLPATAAEVMALARAEVAS